MVKKIIWTVLMVCISLMVWNALPAQAEEGQIVEYSITNVVPGYEYLFEEEEISGYVDWDDSTYLAGIQTISDNKSAVSYVKSQFMNRTTNFSFRFTGSEATQDNIYNLVKGAQANSVESVTDGDYLRANIIAWTIDMRGIEQSWYDVALTMTYTSSAAQEAQVTTKVKSIINSLGLRTMTDEETKVRAIHDYLTTNVVYDKLGAQDTSNYLCHSTYSALVLNKTVCQGYASAFYRLCKEVGVQARFVTGNAGIAHAWNIVKIGDYWYNIDCTWDEGGRYTYYLRDNQAFADHQRDYEYATPEFNKAHPMYGESRDGSIKVSNPVANTYACIDGTTVSSTANGKAKLLIYVGATSGYSIDTVKSIAESGWINSGKVDVVVVKADARIYTQASELNSMMSFKDRCAANNATIKFAAKAGSAANDDMWVYARQLSLSKANTSGGNTIAFPVIIFIDKNNYVRYAHSFLPMTADEIEREVLSKYIDVAEDNATNAYSNVQSFVGRLYTVALGRQYDSAGLNDWTNKLVKGEMTGAEVAQGFFFSQEFRNKNLSDADYVDTLYRTMFNREADSEGRADWLDALTNGMSREFVFRGFAQGVEFKNLCDSFGIKQGTVALTQNRDKNRKLTAFVARNYTKALGRAAEEAGINDWTGRIIAGNATPADVTAGFIFSAEFAGKNLGNEEFLRVVYQTYFDREPDAEGYNNWLSQLSSGVSREFVVNNGFSNSQEFKNLVASFGL